MQDDPPLPEDDENKEKRTDDISSWDADFLKVLLDPFFMSLFSESGPHSIWLYAWHGTVRKTISVSSFRYAIVHGTLLFIHSFQTTKLHISLHGKFLTFFGSNVGFLIKFLDAKDTK